MIGHADTVTGEKFLGSAQTRQGARPLHPNMNGFRAVPYAANLLRKDEVQ